MRAYSRSALEKVPKAIHCAVDLRHATIVVFQLHTTHCLVRSNDIMISIDSSVCIDTSDRTHSTSTIILSQPTEQVWTMRPFIPE